jgi:ATP-dependent DNA ligase
MLSRSGPIPSGDYAFEVKWDGFRALLSNQGEFRVLSRRGWNMTGLLPELRELPASGVFDASWSPSPIVSRTSRSSASGS